MHIPCVRIISLTLTCEATEAALPRTQSSPHLAAQAAGHRVSSALSGSEQAPTPAEARELGQFVGRDAENKGTKDHINRRILCSRSKAQDKGDSTKTCFGGSFCLRVVCWAAGNTRDGARCKKIAC